MAQSIMVRYALGETNPWDWYGKIPENCSRHQLVQVLAKGIKNFQMARTISIRRGWEDAPVGRTPFGDVFMILDSWCREDALLDNMISIDDFEDIIKEIVVALSNGR